jgi:hypothetical protein
MWAMGELEVRSAGARVVVSSGERLAFGRRNTDPSTSRGWGYEGRFLDLSADSHLHRIWGEVLCEGGLWTVRSLGSIHPVVVVPDGQRPIELGPLRPGAEPSAYAATRPVFVISLSVGTESFELHCSVRGAVPPAPPGRAAAGSDTLTLGLDMADCITPTEFAVLWVMGSEFRADPALPDPRPLSYSRVMRSSGLTERQAVGAVERVVQRFRARDLVPPEVSPGEQRAWLCRQLVTHRVFAELERRHGPPDGPDGIGPGPADKGQLSAEPGCAEAP